MEIKDELQPTGLTRPKKWNEDVENLYRFQLAGYRDERDYVHKSDMEIVRWPNSGYVKKLKRQDGCFLYFNRARECSDKDVPKCKIYKYSK
ncbi:hypothetical protein SNEBB_006228 [Seison nebaliae]|nr:hypothetical protein SNEBB_006228 [Seison nebaliae]